MNEPFFIAFAFSALRCACAGFMFLSLGIVEYVWWCNAQNQELNEKLTGFGNSAAFRRVLVHRPARGVPSSSSA